MSGGEGWKGGLLHAGDPSPAMTDNPMRKIGSGKVCDYITRMAIAALERDDPSKAADILLNYSVELEDELLLAIGRFLKRVESQHRS